MTEKRSKTHSIPESDLTWQMLLELTDIISGAVKARSGKNASTHQTESRIPINLRPPLDKDPQSYQTYLMYQRSLEKIDDIKSRYRLYKSFIKTGLSKAAFEPKISIVVPVYKSNYFYLKSMIKSVLNQTDPRFELILCDDGSGDPKLTDILMNATKQDRRVNLVCKANGGISSATNEAILHAKTDWIAFLDHDDELTKNAVATVIASIEANPDIDVFYSDEDKLDPYSTRCNPFFKPDYSPEFLLSSNYICHFTVMRKKLIEKVGYLRSEFDGSQDWDLIMRVSEITDKIHHIPEILYHWRMCEGSAAAEVMAKPEAISAGKRVISEALERRNEDLEISDDGTPGIRPYKLFSKTDKLVSIIIPFRDEAAVLRTCYETLSKTMNYQNVEWILINNGSSDIETLVLMDKLSSIKNIKIVTDDRIFNWSLLNNNGASHAKGEVFLFLNNDLESKKFNWLRPLLAHVFRKNVGAVGGRLLYPDGTIQHAGVRMGLGGYLDHDFKWMPGNEPGYFAISQVLRNVSAVTGACMATRRELFEKTGGFEENLSVAFNDVDYCFKLRQEGYRIVYEPECELVHHESKSRGRSNDVKDFDLFYGKWKTLIDASDPYYNKNLDRAHYWWAI